MYHFVEEGFVCRAKRFSDDAYADVLDGIVVCCADCALVSEDWEVLLGKRTDEPAKGFFWVMGGRMTPGDDPRETAKRVLNREIGLDVPRIESIIDLQSTGSYVFRTRSQEPKNHGCHMVGLNHYLVIKNDDKDRLVKQKGNPNFSQFIWRPLMELMTNKSYHFGIRQIATAIVMVRARNRFH